MLYRILKFIFSYTIRKYFLQVNVLNEERIPLDKPVLLLPNHRSAFMDPIVVATQIKRTTFFLTRGESFNNPIAVKIFKRLKMIPIYRKEYDPDKVNQNQDIFENCYRLMEEGGCLMIFPEGICQTKFLLAPLKTGSARIALEAEDLNKFNLDIHLIPVGINYSNPHRFRGNLTISIGEPIRAKDYEEAYRKEPWDAAVSLTEAVDRGLRNEIVILEDQSEIDTIHQIEELVEKSDIDVPFAKEEWYTNRKAMLDFIQDAKAHDFQQWKDFRYQLSRYTSAKNKLGIVDQPHDLLTIVGQFIILVIGFPIFVLGFILHGPPFALTRWVSLKVVRRVDFMGSLVMVLGLLFFTIFGVLHTYIVYKLTLSNYITIAFFVVWPYIGLITYGYWSLLHNWSSQLRWYRLGKRRRRLQHWITNEKMQLLSQLKSFELKKAS